ncbi:MAG TPA: hypothetical protein VJ727_12130 [Rhodanobacteraceae bacterium]|nr:hypothetical protein [Rhodanobacteraceae bacterium]
MSAAGYELKFQDHGDYLRVVIDGVQDSLEMSLAYWNEIAAECERRGTRALLVLDQLPGEPIPPQDQDRVIQALRESYMRQVRVAYCEADSVYLPQAEYGELVAREAGYTVRVFASEREAELWLRYGVS